jgi:hypothetical protein
MKILYLTSGSTGAGRVVRGIAIGNALKRNHIECDFTIVSGSPFSRLAETLNIHHLDIPLEPVEHFSKHKCRDTAFYKTLLSQDPDVILVDLIWFPLHHFIEELECKKVFLCRQVDESFFSIDLPDNPMTFHPESYDLLMGIEPFQSSIALRFIDPLVLRNREEILSRAQACERLGIDPDERTCILAYSGHPGDFERVKTKYSYLESEYQMVCTTTYERGIFPVMDYYNCADFIVCGAGYNSFWEAAYLDKDALVVPTHARFESGKRRIEECWDYRFERNGADQLAEMIMAL